MQTESVKGVRFDDLRMGTCRFPLGSPVQRVEFFCGEPTRAGCSWCKEHRKRVFSRHSVNLAHKKVADRDE